MELRKVVDIIVVNVDVNVDVDVGMKNDKWIGGEGASF